MLPESQPEARCSAARAALVICCASVQMPSAATARLSASLMVERSCSSTLDSGRGLDLLLSAVKRERFDTRSPQHAALLEPLLPLLQRAMRVDADAVVSLALRTLCALVPQPGRNHPALRQPQLASHPCLSDDRLLLCGGSPRPGAAPEPRRFSQQRGRPKVAP